MLKKITAGLGTYKSMVLRRYDFEGGRLLSASFSMDADVFYAVPTNKMQGKET
ncbi:MAG TPA: hypothetical protein VJ577_05810 [Burkholderiaceae bacterium]|nr:hypothetical protein [Burkholderiaceae bacterium]